MSDRLHKLPFFVILLILSGIAMLLPAVYAVMLDAFAIARCFTYFGIFVLLLSSLVAISMNSYKPKNVARNHLLTLVSAYFLLPVVFAVPFYEGHGQTNFLNAWFEMLSDFTTL